MLLWLAIQPALAGAPGYYHPDDIAGKSQQFAQAADAMGPAFDEVQMTLSRLGRSLEALERSTALLGDAAPPELAVWFEQTQRSVTGQYLQVQKHVNLLGEDYATVFTEAVSRAVAQVSANHALTECTQSGGVSSMLRRSASGASTTCSGTDFNDVIATAIDADPLLRADVTELNALEWPSITIEPVAQPVAPVTGTARYVMVGRLAKKYLEDHADARLEAFEDALSPIEDDVNAGDPEAIAEAGRLKEAYLAGLAEDGAVLRAALETSLAKAGKKVPGLSEVGLCANPAGLGGCEGEDITSIVMDLLREDRKFQKAIAKL